MSQYPIAHALMIGLTNLLAVLTIAKRSKNFLMNFLMNFLIVYYCTFFLGLTLLLEGGAIKKIKASMRYVETGFLACC